MSEHAINENIGAAFRAMLAGDEGAMRRHLAAAAEATEANMKPWRFGAPYEDAAGAIVFRDPGATFNYTVSHVTEAGAHVRTYWDPRYPVQSCEVEGRAPTWEEAEKLARAALDRQPGDEVKLIGGGRDGSGLYFVRYRKSRTPLD